MIITAIVGSKRKCHSSLDFIQKTPREKNVWCMYFDEEKDDSQVRVYFTPDQLKEHLNMIVKALSEQGKPESYHYGHC